MGLQHRFATVVLFGVLFGGGWFAGCIAWLLVESWLRVFGLSFGMVSFGWLFAVFECACLGVFSMLLWFGLGGVCVAFAWFWC